MVKKNHQSEPRPMRKEPDYTDVAQRLSAVEVHVQHLNINMGELKGDVKELREEIKESRKEARAEFKWMLGVAALIIGIMAKGFGWIGF